MEKFKGSLTSDFKNSNKRKNYKCEIFIAHYNNGDYYKIFFDREDERRQVLTLEGNEMKDFFNKMQELISINK